MPSTVPIGIFLVSQTRVNRKATREWLDFIGAGEFELPPEGSITDAALDVSLSGKRCYKAFTKELNPNLTRIRTDYGEYIDNILKSGHGSVCEHPVYKFAIENVSRVFTGEMNRHRAGWAISEGSMRFIRFSENIPYWLPTCLEGPAVMLSMEPDDVLDPGLACPELIAKVVNGCAVPLEAKKHLTRYIFDKGFSHQQWCYKLMEWIWADELKPESKFKGKKEITSMMRRLVGMGCATGGTWTGNVRALRHVITMRAAPEAEEEILHVFTRIAKMMRDEEPMLFGDFYQDDQGYWRPKYKKV